MKMRKPIITDTGADISPDRLFRYRLWRRWGDGPSMTFIGLNPSTADEAKDDQTIRKCIGFALRNGCEAVEMLNLFAFRARHPADLKAAVDPIGPKNDATLLQSSQQAQFVVACWGSDGRFEQRDATVIAMLQDNGIVVKCLGTTQMGLPRHPVMCPYSATITSFSR